MGEGNAMRVSFICGSFWFLFVCFLFFKLLCYSENFHPLLASLFLRGDVKSDVSQNSFKKPFGVPEPHK